MKFLTSAFVLAVLLANPAAAVVIADTMMDHQWTTQVHVEVATGSTGATKDRSRTKR